MIYKKENTIEEFRKWIGTPPELTQEQKELIEKFSENFINVLNRIDISKNKDGVIVKRLKGEKQ